MKVKIECKDGMPHNTKVFTEGGQDISSLFSRIEINIEAGTGCPTAIFHAHVISEIEIEGVEIEDVKLNFIELLGRKYDGNISHIDNENKLTLKELEEADASVV